MVDILLEALSTVLSGQNILYLFFGVNSFRIIIFVNFLC